MVTGMMSRLYRLIQISLAFVVLTVACTGGSDRATPARTVPVGESATPVITLVPPPTQTPVPEPTPTRTSASMAAPGPTGEMTAVQVYDQFSPSVAFVKTPTVKGSGFLVEGGYVVTNHHVVHSWEEVTLIFPDGSEFQAPVAAWDPMSDIALLGPVEARVPPLELGDGENLPIGSEIFLLGYSGETAPSPNPTILSGLLSHYRQWNPANMTYLQTDAAIAGGQSGGVLLNAKGEVIGIVGFSFTEANYALAASAADLEPILQQLIQGRDPSGVSNRRFREGQPENEFQGSLGNPWDSRMFLIEVTPGSSVEIEIDCAKPVRFNVTDLAGNVLLDVDNSYGGVGQGSAEVKMEGYHFLTVDTPAHSSSCFDLTSNVPMIPFNDPDDGRQLNLHEPIAGNIDYPGDRDWYVINLEEGELVRISADSLNVDAVLRVDFPNSRPYQVVRDDDSGGGLFETNSELVYRAPVTGEYFVVIEDYSGWELGGYFLSVDRASSRMEAFTVPSSLEEVDSPFGKMIVYESRLSDFSVQVPAEWIQVYPGEDDPGFTYFAVNSETEEGEIGFVAILEFDLREANESQDLEELADSVLEELSGGGFETHREMIVTASGDPGVVVEFRQGVEPDRLYTGRMLASILDERFAFVLFYVFTEDEFHRGLAEYSLGALESSGERIAAQPSDRKTLAALYNATDGRNWRNSDGWLSDRPIGEWYGVVADANGSVIGLHLDENRLNGVMPWELGRLSDLELLNLSNNRLVGAIPAELGRLSNLTALFLNGNDLTGEIPSELGSLARLEILHLQFNNLTGGIPSELSNLARLRQLDLGVNELAGEIPPELGSLSNLTSLWLGWNDLTGEIPPELGSLGNLTRLWVNNNRLEGCIPGSLAGQLDDQSNVGDLQFCEGIPLQSSNQEDADQSKVGAPPSAGLAKYADRHAHGPGAIYVGDINHLAGPAPTVGQGGFGGNVPLESLERHNWLYESPLYEELLEKARLTDPTPMTYDGPAITIQHVCINRALLPCQLMETYLAPNLRERTNGKLELITSSFPELGLAGPDTLSLVAGGTLDLATVYGGYVAGQIPEIDIQNLWGIYSSREQEFDATLAILKDIEDLVLAETGGVAINHSWYAGNDQFLFCRERIDSLDGFAGKRIRSHSTALSDWLNGMGAEPRFVAFAEVYVELDRGSLDCAFTGAFPAHGQRWYEVAEYMIGPLFNFPAHSNVINENAWNSIPADLQQILLEEAARSELEAMRLAAVQFEKGLTENQDAGLELIPFSPDILTHSFETAAMEHVIPAWMRRMGRAGSPFVSRAFNPKLGPIVGLRIESDGLVVKVPPAEGTDSPTAAVLTPRPAVRPQEWTVVTEGRPLHEAAMSGSQADVEEALDKGADVNATAKVQVQTWEVSSLTPLHLASALNDDPGVAMLLLDRGADIKAEDDYGWRPLYWAANYNDNPEVVSLLLDRGADIEAEDDGGRTPLHWAALSNDNPEVVALLMDQGSDVNAKDDDGETPLHFAASSNANSEVVALLLDRGSDIEAEGEVGATPLHYAAWGNDNPEVTVLLLDWGAGIEVKDDDGWTPLHTAAGFNDNPEVVELLLDRGADVQAANNDGDTPCQLAREREGFMGTPVLDRLCAP